MGPTNKCGGRAHTKCPRASSRVAGRSRQVVRERQGLIVRRRAEDKRLLEAIGKADATATGAIRATIVDLDTNLDAIDKRLAKEFPEYAELSDPKPLSIGTVQALLRPDEALLVFLDVPRIGRLPGETIAWAVTKAETRWIGIPLGTEELAERVMKLRCGLDPRRSLVLV